MYNSIGSEKVVDCFQGERVIVVPYNIKKLQQENPITRQMYVTHIGYYPHVREHKRVRLDGCDENILIYCADGSGWISYKGEEFTLKRDQAFIIPANEAHAYGASSIAPWTIYWIHFQGENTYMFSSIIGKVLTIEEADNSRYSDREQLFEEIYQNLEMGYSHENLEYVSFCLIYLLASLKYIPQFREIKTAKESSVVQKSTHYMRDNLENKITVHDIASHAGYSEARFNAIFQQKTSYTPMAYYNQLKMQRACSYLQFSDMKIKEIAFRLQFYDQFHFSKTFRQEIGMPPKEYRKMHKDDRQSFGV